MNNKLLFSRWLMIVAVCLIAAFQLYWLTKLYNEEKHSLKRTADIAFKESMYKVQAERFKADTLIFKGSRGKDDIFLGDVANVLYGRMAQMDAKDMDSVKKPAKITLSVSSEITKTKHVAKPDSLSMSPGFSFRFNPDNNGISISLQGLPDSVKEEVMKHMMMPQELDSAIQERMPGVHVPKGKSTMVMIDGDDTIVKVKSKPAAIPKPDSMLRSFMVQSRTINDSIPIVQISAAYKAGLAKNGIRISFSVSKDSIGDKKDSLATSSKIIQTSAVPVGLFSKVEYHAKLENATVYLLQKISPQIILSLLLVAVTLVAFSFLYRNLIAQKRLADMKDEFISNITHELKTPIATVNVAIEALRNFGGLQNPERTKEYLDISASELQRLSLLVDKVLKLSMFESENIELHTESLNIKDLVENAMSTMKLQFDKQHAVTSFTVKGDNFILSADKLHIMSVVYNLLDNALKYSKGNPHIDVSLESQEQYAELRIKDNGIGIPAAYQEKVFDKFFRVPTGNRHNTKGYGLGLSYVAHIVRSHNGSIRLESEEGKGSIFIVRLPLAYYLQTPV